MTKAAGAGMRWLVALAIGFGSFVVPATPAAAEVTFVVTAAGDAGAGTLRQAVLAANQVDDDAVIELAVSAVTLTSGQVAYNGGVGGDHSLRIEGAGQTISQTFDGARVLASTSSGTLEVVGLTLTGGDTSACGGAINSAGPLEITRSTLTGNTSTCGGGGAFGGATVIATDSTISGNVGGASGGGLRAATTVTLVRSTVSTNTAQFGAGVIANTLLADRSTLDGNQASGLGGGAYVQAATLTNSTVSGNSAGDHGGGISAQGGAPAGAIELVYSTITGNNSLVSKNLSGTTLRSFGSYVGGSCGFSGGTTSDGYNRSSDVSCGFTNVVGGDLQNVNAQLGPLADNGGPTRTHAPQAGSPLIDAIPAGSCQSAGAAGITFDQRGQGRPFGNGCDIGAVEVRGGAQTKTWSGPAGGAWSTPTHWTPTGVPLDGDSLVFPAGSSSVDDLADLTVAAITGAAGAAVTQAPGAGGIELTGGITGNLALGVPVALPAGTHTLSGDITVSSVAGPGDVSITSGLVTFTDADGFDGDIAVVAGRFAGDLGSALGGLTIDTGAAARPSIAGDVAEPIHVQGASGTAELDVVAAAGARLTGPIDLDADLVVPNPAVLAGAITGAGGLSIRGGELSGANTYAGGTDVQSTVRIATSTALGTGAVTLDQTGALRLAPGIVLANAISRHSTIAGPTSLIITEGAAQLSGAITITGTTPTRLHVAVGTTLDVSGSIQAVAPVQLVAGLPAQPVVAHSASALIGGPTSMTGGFSVNGVDATLADATIGGAVTAGLGAITFGAGAVVQASAQLLANQGVLSLAGYDQSAASASIVGGSELHLGRLVPGGADVARLTLSGAFSHQGGSDVEFMLDGTANDQVRASSVALDPSSSFAFHLEDPSPVGTVHRIVDNTGAQPVSQTWQGAPEGSLWQVGTTRYRLSYQGGTGNDVTLTHVAGFDSTWQFEAPVQHGGGLRGGPGVSSWGPGRMDAWIAGLDGSVWHRFSQTGLGAGWESLGGTTLSTPAGVSQQPGEADVFVRGTDNALWTRSYRNGWGPWVSLGGILTDGPSVTSPSPGNLVVTVRSTNGSIWMRRMVSGVWQGWVSLDGGTTHTPAVTDWGDGRQDVFIRGLDGGLWQRPILNGVPGAWINHGGILTDAPAVAAPGADELAVFIRGADGSLWMRSWEGTGWSDWRNLNVAIDARPGAAGVGPGELQLGIRAADGSLWTYHATSLAFEAGG